MATSNLNREAHEIHSGNDSIVIVKALGDIPGGRTLNVEGFDGTVVKAGHVVIAKGNDYKPMPVNGEAYGDLPEGYNYVGVVKATITTKDPRSAIVTLGQVNEAASPYPVTSAMKNALKIQFLYGA